MQKLPLPLSNQISAIIHISDFHIRIGDLEKSRYNDYVEVINNLECAISKLPQVKQKSVVVIFTGDMFDIKNKLDSFSVLLFNMLINSITKLDIPLYMICGNHDLLQNDYSIPDVISSLLYGNKNHLVSYLNKTGHYLAGNVGLGVVAIKDILKANSGTGHTNILPDFPDAGLFPPQVTTKIALVHGPFKNSILQNNLINHEGLPIDWIKSRGYHCALLGDIHLRQCHPDNNWSSQFVWAYPSSLIQLNFGEPYDEHGFLLWDLDKKEVVSFDISCPSKFLNVLLENDSLMCHLDRKNKLTIEQFIQNEKITKPKNLYIKIKGDITPCKIDDLSDTLRQHNITPHITKGLILTPSDTNMPVQQQNQTHMDISQYNAPQMWIQYIEQHDTEHVLTSAEWHDWIAKPITLLLSNLCINIKHPSLLETIKTRDKDITQLVEKLDATQSQNKVMKKDAFIIKHMDFSYILCFGRNNYFNFDQSNGKITLIAGSNSSGKSSFLEVLLVGLYGTDIPSRRDRLGLYSVICKKIPPNECAQITIKFSVGNNCYQIARVFEQNDYKNTLITKKISLTQISPNNNIISTSVKSINDWVIEHVGQFEHFIMSCLVSQSSDADFFSLKDQEQIDLLDKSLNISQIDNLSNIIKTTSLGIDAIEKQIITLRTHLVGDKNNDLVDQTTLDQINQTIVVHKTRLEQLCSEHDNIRELWYDLKEDDLQSDALHISTQITALQEKIKNLNIDETMTFQQLSAEKTLIDDKISHMEKVEEYDNITQEEATTRLSELQNIVISQPQCTKEYYQQQLDMICDWRQKNKESLMLTHDEIVDKISKCESCVQEYNQQLQELIKDKPNQHEINSNDYIEFVKAYKKVMSDVNRLPEPYNEINQLSAYCQKSNLYDVNSLKQLPHLKELYNEQTNKVQNQSLMIISMDTLKTTHESKKHQKRLINIQLETLCTQIEHNEHECEQLSQIIDNYTDKISGIGEVTKPQKTLSCITEWLQSFKTKKESYDQKVILFDGLNKQYTRLVKINENNQQITCKLSEINDNITQLEKSNMDLPFNPDCPACQSQPWRVHHQQLLSQKEQLTSQVTQTIPEQEMNVIKEKVDQLDQWLNDYKHRLKRFQEYSDMEHNWIIYEEKTCLLKKYREEKIQQQAILDKTKKNLQSLKKQQKSLESDKDKIQQDIDELSYVINHFDKWIEMKQNIAELEQYEKDNHLYQVYKQYTRLNINYYQLQKDLMEKNEQWSNAHDELKKLITHNCGSIERLKHDIVLVDQDDQYSKSEKEYHSRLDQWEKYDLHHKQYNMLQNVILRHNLNRITQQISKREQSYEFLAKIQYWETVIKNQPSFMKKKQLSQLIAQTNTQVQQLTIQYEKSKQLFELTSKKIEEIKELDLLLEKITTKQKEISFINKILANYRIWLYTEIIIPKIVLTINNIVSNVTQSDEYSLNANVTIDRYNKININWSINNPLGASTPLSKVGGFRRSLYGLIMRVSLSHMGCSINNSQLFIDEGFTSADSDNLEKMSQFLTNLIEFYPQGIITMSHLQQIKECASITYNIGRNSDMTSCIQFDKVSDGKKPKLTLIGNKITK